MNLLSVQEVLSICIERLSILKWTRHLGYTLLSNVHKTEQNFKQINLLEKKIEEKNRYIYSITLYCTGIQCARVKT